MYVKVIIKLQMIVNLFLETNEKDKKNQLWTIQNLELN